MTEHMADNAKDRRTGAHWERQFCVMAGHHGKIFTPHQLGRPESASAHGYGNGKWNHYVLPDVTIWSAPGEHHEVKHKEPNKHGSYGLEQYRLRPLIEFARETQQAVMYTIHDWKLAGASCSDEEVPNDLDHWVTANILDLAEADYIVGNRHGSYVRGKAKQNVPICYWRCSLFVPLAQWWGTVSQPKSRHDSALMSCASCGEPVGWCSCADAVNHWCPRCPQKVDYTQGTIDYATPTGGA